MGADAAHGDFPPLSFVAFGIPFDSDVFKDVKSTSEHGSDDFKDIKSKSEYRPDEHSTNTGIRVVRDLTR